MSANVDQAFVRQMQKRFEEELNKKEREFLEYWRGELDRLMQKRHQDLASLSNDLKQLRSRMDKRLTSL